jgi:hypothetical protein
MTLKPLITSAHHQDKPKQAPRGQRDIMLPVQERVLMNEYLATGDLGEAARRAGITRNRALSALRSLAWLDELRRQYEASGLTARQIGLTLTQALEANLQVVVRDGLHSQRVEEYPDWARRLKALEMVISLHVTMAKAAPAQFEEDTPVERQQIVTPTEIAGMTRAQVLALVDSRLAPRDRAVAGD